MARNFKKTEFEEDNSQSPSVTVRLPKKIFKYTFIALIFVGLIYFVAKFLLVASVNGQFVSRLTVIKELEKQGGKKTLDTVIIKALINQEAKKRNLSISEKELEAELLKIEKNIASQGTTIEALLQQQGMTKNDLANEIRLQLLVTKMVDNNVSVTDKEIEEYISSQKDLPTLGGDKPSVVTKDQAMAVVKQQKIQAKIQTFISDLKAKAKINYFIKY